MELHGGSLSIKSEVEKGTIVTVKFPSYRTAKASNKEYGGTGKER